MRCLKRNSNCEELISELQPRLLMKYSSSQSRLTTQLMRWIMVISNTNSEYNPVLLSTLADDSFIQDVVGPEQVSPHYESFGVSRKWALLTIGGYMGMNYMGQVIDLHWVFQSMLIPFISYLTIIYWNVEGKKSYFMPIQYEWYNKLSHHEMDLLHAFWPDQVREKIRQNQRVAREQMEYYEVHTDFNDIKAESVNRVYFVFI